MFSSFNRYVGILDKETVMTAIDQPSRFRTGPIHRTSALRRVLLWISRRFDRASQLAVLEEMEDHRLVDIGLTREDIRRLRARQFWR